MIESSEIGLTGSGTDLTITTYGNGAFLARQAVHALVAKDISARVGDLRWSAPCLWASLLPAVAECAADLIVDECRRGGSPSEAVFTHLAGAGCTQMPRLTAEDSFIATGPAYAATLPSRAGIVAAALALLGTKPAPKSEAARRGCPVSLSR